MCNVTTKLITGCQHLPYSERLSFLRLESLEHKCLLADLTMTYNIIHGHSSITKSDFFKPTTNKTSRGHPLRLVTPLTRLNVRRHFLTDRIIKAWNSLPTHVVLTPSTNSFKQLIRSIDLSTHLIFPTYFRSKQNKTN